MKEIHLTNTTEKVLIDDEDHPVISRLNWYKSDMGYAITDTPVKHLKMHKLLIGGIPPKTVIDHIDRNKLNNRKDNLRIVSQTINCRNSYSYDNAKHYYLDKRRGTWVVEFKELGIRYIPAKSPEMANRIAKRIKLGFPADVAVKESKDPTIAISNWPSKNIDYDEYMESVRLGVSIKDMRRGKRVES